jgi:hypothetical protein
VRKTASLYVNFTDPELNILNPTITGLNSYITFDSMTKLIHLTPPFTLTNNSKTTVTIVISDGINTAITHSFDVTVLNKRPRFQTIPANLSRAAGIYEKILLPYAIDPEGAQITVTCTNL